MGAKYKQSKKLKMFGKIKNKIASLEEAIKNNFEEIKTLKKEIEKQQEYSQNLEKTLEETQKELANSRLRLDGDRIFYAVVTITTVNAGRGSYGSCTTTDKNVKIGETPIYKKKHWDDGFWSEYSQTITSYPIEPVGYKDGKYIFIYEDKKYFYKLK